jgi:NDP-sugar pyrophosphorylase family protein
MKAMILAAGVGSRLRPLTEEIPKALVKVGNKTMLENNIDWLASYGFDEIIVNVHHLAEKIKAFVKEKADLKASVTFSEEKNELLNTGGGLKQAGWFFDERDPFIVTNVDILCNLNLEKLLAFHKKTFSLATLVVRERESSRYLLFDESYRLCGWENIKTNEKKITLECQNIKRYAFSGIQIMSPEMFSYMPKKSIFSLIDLYLNVNSDVLVSGFLDTESDWFDIGNLEKLNNARRFAGQQ